MRAPHVTLHTRNVPRCAVTGCVALTRLALGDPARAQEALGRALHIDPNHAEAKKLSADRRLRE